MQVVDAISQWGLDSKLAHNLLQDGISSFFPVQNDVIPKLLKQNSKQCIEPQDICVSAPTGSGKTLSYALPIVDTLVKESPGRLRALILLPSRELANQVYSVFNRISRSTRLKIALVTGQTNFEQEQNILLGLCGNSIDSGINEYFSNKELYTAFEKNKCKSNIDILVCTSGRLLDHLQFTEGFTLQHLRFLVLDEADRLLGNAYHSWVRLLIQSTSSSSINSLSLTADYVDDDCYRSRRWKRVKVHDSPTQLHSLKPSLQRLLFSATLTDNPSKLALLGIYSPLLIHSSSYVAMLPSSNSSSNNEGTDISNCDKAATGHTEQFDVNYSDCANDTEFFNDDTDVLETAVDHNGAPVEALLQLSSFTLPAGLSESRIICESEQRPLTLIGILLEALSSGSKDDDEEVKRSVSNKKHKHRGVCSDDNKSMIIVFTSSVEETHRLCKLLQIVNGQIDNTDNSTSSATSAPLLFRGGRVEEMSRMVRAEQRMRTMNDAKEGLVSVLISSDHMARGIDLPNIRLVVNYDPPKHVKTYVHRAGRTARAQRIGHCVTMLNVGQLGTFRKLRGQVDNNQEELTTENFNVLLGKCSIRKTTLENVTNKYKQALKRLAKALKDN